MKAIDLLSWVVSEHILTESMDIIDVDEGFDFETFFGSNPDAPSVPDGKYVYLWGDTVDEKDVERLLNKTEDQPYTITLPDEDHLNGGLTVIWLFKLED